MVHARGERKEAALITGVVEGVCSVDATVGTVRLVHGGGGEGEEGGAVLGREGVDDVFQPLLELVGGKEGGLGEDEKRRLSEDSRSLEDVAGSDESFALARDVDDLAWEVLGSCRVGIEEGRRGKGRNGG